MDRAMKLSRISQIFGALVLCAAQMSAAALTFESSATCTAGSNTVTGGDSCLARSGFTFAAANSAAQPLDYGEVDLSVGVVMEGNGNSASISATAGFEDFFIVYEETEGNPGFLELTTNVYSSTNDIIEDAIRLAGRKFDLQPHYGGSMTLIVPFNFGDVMDFAVFFSLSAAAEDCEEGCQGGAAASAGFAFPRFRVLDAGGQALSGYKFHTESETKYDFAGGTFQDPSAVPEPATYALTGIALLMAGLLRRRLPKA